MNLSNKEINNLMSTDTTAVTDVRKYEQKIIFGQELPSFPENYKHPDSIQP